MGTDDAPVLERMFGISVERFLAEAWPHQPRHAAAANLAGLVEHPALRDIATFLRDHRGRGSVRRGAVWTEHAWIEDALVGFAQGDVLDLGSVDQRVPAVRVWIDRLVGELSLGFGAHQGTCRALVGRAGSTIVEHFDHRDQFLVQIHGRTRWTLAPNEQPAPLATQLASTPVIPSDADAIELEPGGALFIPRGYWEAAEILDDSLVLAFTFRVPPWVDLVVHAALAILASEPAWRATVEGEPSPEVSEAMDRAIERLIGIELPRRR